MRHKQFFGTNLQDAMKRAVTAMGNDVVLLESESIKMGSAIPDGNRLVRITVGVPTKTTYLEKQTKRKIHSDRSSDDVLNAYLHDRKSVARFTCLDSEMTNPEDLRQRFVQTGLLTRDVEEFFNWAKIDKPLNGPLSDKVIIDMIKKELVTFLNSMTTEQKNSSFRILALVGPTGVGKTSTIMKMALDPRICRNKKVVIISMDHYRIAAMQTLEIFSRISKIPFHSARDADELKQLLERFSDFDQVFIDTPGRSPFFPNHFQELNTILKSREDIDIDLVLSATADLEDIFLSFGLLSLLHPAGIIFTKIDETSRPGKLVSIMKEAGLPVHYLTDGQNISGNLHPFSATELWHRIEQVL